MAREERRRFPRIADDSFAMELRIGEYDAIIHTLNISASGVYCKVDRQIPLMSRVELVLMIPGMRKDEGSAGGLEVTGVVVREHPVIIDGQTKHYDVAIFFDDLSAKDSEIIADYISKKNR